MAFSRKFLLAIIVYVLYAVYSNPSFSHFTFWNLNNKIIPRIIPIL